MIIDDINRFIFVHVPKTGGESVRTMFKSTIQSCPSVYAIHEPLHEWQKTITESQQKYFKFAFVRNPWDRLYSLYSYYQPYKHLHCELSQYRSLGMHHFYESTFERWLFEESWPKWDLEQQMPLPYQQLPQMWYVKDDKDNIGVDLVARFETYNTEMLQICERLGQTAPKMVHKNRSKRTSGYRQHYTTKMVDYVYKHHVADIEAFGYEF